MPKNPHQPLASERYRLTAAAITSALARGARLAVVGGAPQRSAAILVNNGMASYANRLFLFKRGVADAVPPTKNVKSGGTAPIMDAVTYRAMLFEDLAQLRSLKRGDAVLVQEDYMWSYVDKATTVFLLERGVKLYRLVFCLDTVWRFAKFMSLTITAEVHYEKSYRKDILRWFGLSEPRFKKFLNLSVAGDEPVRVEICPLLYNGLECLEGKYVGSIRAPFVPSEMQYLEVVEFHLEREIYRSKSEPLIDHQSLLFWATSCNYWRLAAILGVTAYMAGKITEFDRLLTGVGLTTLAPVKMLVSSLGIGLHVAATAAALTASPPETALNSEVHRLALESSEYQELLRFPAPRNLLYTIAGLESGEVFAESYLDSAATHTVVSQCLEQYPRDSKTPTQTFVAQHLSRLLAVDAPAEFKRGWLSCQMDCVAKVWSSGAVTPVRLKGAETPVLGLIELPQPGQSACFKQLNPKEFAEALDVVGSFIGGNEHTQLRYKAVLDSLAESECKAEDKSYYHELCKLEIHNQAYRPINYRQCPHNAIVSVALRNCAVAPEAGISAPKFLRLACDAMTEALRKGAEGLNCELETYDEYLTKFTPSRRDQYNSVRDMTHEAVVAEALRGVRQLKPNVFRTDMMVKANEGVNVKLSKLNKPRTICTPPLPYLLALGRYARLYSKICHQVFNGKTPIVFQSVTFYPIYAFGNTALELAELLPEPHEGDLCLEGDGKMMDRSHTHIQWGVVREIFEVVMRPYLGDLHVDDFLELTRAEVRETLELTYRNKTNFMRFAVPSQTVTGSYRTSFGHTNLMLAISMLTYTRKFDGFRVEEVYPINGGDDFLDIIRGPIRIGKWKNSRSRKLAPQGKTLSKLAATRRYVASVNGIKLDPCTGNFVNTDVLERRKIEFLSLRLTLDADNKFRFAVHPARVLYKLCHAYSHTGFPETRFAEKCLGIRDAAQSCPILGPLVNQVLKYHNPSKAYYDEYSMLRPGGTVWKPSETQIDAYLAELGIVKQEYESYLKELPKMVGLKHFRHQVLDAVFEHYGLV